MTLFERVKQAKIEKSNEMAGVAKKILQKLEPVLRKAAGNPDQTFGELDISEFEIKNEYEFLRQLRKSGLERFGIEFDKKTLKVRIPSRKRKTNTNYDPESLYEQILAIRLSLFSTDDSVLKEIVARAEKALMRAVEKGGNKVEINISDLDLEVTNQLATNLKKSGLTGFLFDIYGKTKVGFAREGKADIITISVPTDNVREKD